MKTFLSAVALSALTAGLVATSTAPASATTRSLPAGNYTFVCDPVSGALTMNGKVLHNQDIVQLCSEQNFLNLTIGQPGDTAASVVDLRGVVGTSATFRTNVVVHGPATVHGSPGIDGIRANGTVYGYGGDDALTNNNAQGVPVAGLNQIEGGDGNDYLGCLPSFSVPTPVACNLVGGVGADNLQHAGVGEALGGAGSDTLRAWGNSDNPGAATYLKGGPGIDTAEAYPGADFAGVLYDLAVRPGATAGSLRSVTGPFEHRFSGIEKAIVGATSDRTVDAVVTVTMSPSVPITTTTNTEFAPAALTILVPGGVWTRSSTGVVAPGLAPVTFDHPGGTVRVIAAG